VGWSKIQNNERKVKSTVNEENRSGFKITEEEYYTIKEILNPNRI